MWAALAVMGLSLGLVGCEAEGSPGPDRDDSAAEDTTPVAGFELEAMDLSRQVQASATVEARDRSRLRSRVDGVVEQIDVEEGDIVEAGQVLVELDRSEMRAELARVEAQEARIAAELERKAPLVEREAIGRAEVEDLERDLSVVEREIELWRTRYERAAVVAPRRATVMARHVHEGDDVSQQEVLLELADLTTLVVPVRVSERDVVYLDEGDEASMSIDALGGEWEQAHVRRIFPEAEADSRRLTVELALPEAFEEQGVRPGFMARVRLSVDQRPEALAIPGEALLASTPDDRFVYVIEDGELKRRSLEVGVERRGLREVISGLERGEVIVGTNPTNLSEGEAVHVSEWVEAQ